MFISVALNNISQNNIGCCGLISSHNHNQNYNISSFIIHHIIVRSYYKIPYHHILISKLKPEIYINLGSNVIFKNFNTTLPRTPQAVEVVQFDHRFHSCDNGNRSCPSSNAGSQVEVLQQESKSISQIRSISKVGVW